MKISHIESKVVNEIIAVLKEDYEKVGKITINRGKAHEYLGMTLDCSKPGKFIINVGELPKAK